MGTQALQTPNIRTHSVLLAESAKRHNRHHNRDSNTAPGTVLVPTTLEHIPPGCVHLVHTLAVENSGTEPVFNVSLHSAIPEGTTYSIGSAVCEGAEVYCSSDGGLTYHPEGDQLQVANPCTDVKFQLRELPPKREMYFQFHLFLNS